MEKIDLINEMLNHQYFFDGVSLEDFCLLASLESHELGQITKEVWRVTPLLKQITFYALIAGLLEEDEVAQLTSSLPSNSDVVDEVMDFSSCCMQYIEILLAEDCEHPSITNLMVLINGATYYNEILENASNLAEITADEDLKDELIELINTLDNSIKDVSDLKFDTILEKLTNQIIETPRELLDHLVNYTKNCFITRMLISPAISINSIKKYNDNIYYLGEWYVHTMKDSRIYPDSPLKIGEAINNIAIIMGELETYNHFDTEEEEELLAKLKKGYLFYEKYKYDYLKNHYHEQKLLEKCKKM